MIRMIKGAQIAAAEKLMQGYEISENRLTANVDADNIRNILDSFIDRNCGSPLFMFIEVPANISDEKITEKFEDGSMAIETPHKDVYYLDGLSSEYMKKLLEPLYEILINDGLSSFGAGNFQDDEIGKYKYNQMILFSNDPGKYGGIFEEHGIVYTEKLVSAWDTFTRDTPGQCRRYTDKNGRTVYDIIDLLTQNGMYKAKQRQD